MTYVYLREKERELAYSLNLVINSCACFLAMIYVVFVKMNMKSEKRSLALLSNKRTKAYTRTIADETFSLPSFSDTIPSFTIDTPHKSSKMLWSMHLEHDRNIEKLKQKMLEHELVFKEQASVQV